MDFWGWFLLAVAVGGGLLAVAVLADRHARRRTSGEGEPAPERGIAAVDAQVPAYITQDEVDALPAPGRGVPGDLPHKGEGFGFGHAHPDFATRASGADWARPRILVVDGEVDTMRQLLAPLSAATADAPLIVVAAGFAPEVLTTLAANRRAVGLRRAAAGDRLHRAQRGRRVRIGVFGDHARQLGGGAIVQQAADGHAVAQQRFDPVQPV